MTKQTIARYEIKSEIGRGAMASVYLAYDPNFRRNVAIKLISIHLQENPVFRERFEREAHLIAQIEHPAIVPVYDFGEQNDQLYLVMRHMAGGTLTDKVKEEKSTLEYAVRIMSQIAPALDAVHAQGVVHRDLKPGNILLDGFGNPAISDFGIAHLTASTTDLTGSAIIGTPSYMSPEQVRSDPNLDGRSDVYALGVILFEMLAGRGPFQAETPLSVALKHLTDSIPPIHPFRPDLPMELETVLNKAMAKDPEVRYATASELVFELQEVFDNYKAGKTTAPNKGTIPSSDNDVTEIDTGDDSSLLAAYPPASPRSDPQIASDPSSSSSPSYSKTPQPKRSRIGFPQIILGAAIGLIALFICGSAGLLGTWFQFVRPNFSASQDATAIPTAAETVETILFTDDFSDPASGWPILQNDQGRYSYQQDGYHIAVDQMDAVIWAKTSRSDGNVSLYVDARPVNSSSGYYGLLCRIQDDQNFYYFLVQSNGSYTMGKYKNSGFQPFFTDGWRQSNAIQQGVQTNRLKADCMGNTLRLYVNGTLLAETTDNEFGSGLSGIVAASLDVQSFEVIFNNFLITAPSQ